MKLEFATIGATAYLAHQASALPAEEGFAAKGNVHSRAIATRQINADAASTMKKAGFDLNIELASASVRPAFNTTQCVLTKVYSTSAPSDYQA